MKLTNTAIDALESGKTIRDDAVPGLHVINKSGKRGFYLYFRTKTGDERRPKLGEYGILTLAEARELARSMLAEVAKGGDPVADRKKAKGAPVMEDLWSHCKSTIWNRGVQWDREVERIYHAYVSPKLGRSRVRDLQYPEISGLHSSLKGTPNQANRALAVVSRMFNEAERLGWRDINSNPCGQVERYTELKRKRYARPEEISAIGPLLEAEAARNPAAVAFLYLLMFSGARPSEIARATWKQVERIERDGQVYGVLRIATGKNQDERNVFLPPQAMAVLDRLPKNTPSITGLADTPKKVWDRVRKAAGCKDLWARDWRRTFATQALSNGMAIGVVAELLGHKSTQTTKVYAKLMEDPALQAAASVAGHMEKLLKPSPQ